MLASGKRRVCCFDPSGFYSKAFKAPQPADHAAQYPGYILDVGSVPDNPANLMPLRGTG